MTSYLELFTEHTGRIQALSKIGQIAMEGLGQVAKDSTSPFAPMFKSMAIHLPQLHQNHPAIDMPEYKVVAFMDGLTLIMTVSEVEAYLQDLVVAVLLKHPEKIGKSSFELKSLLELSSIEDVKMLAAQKFASEMLFKKPNEYKKDLISILSLNEGMLSATWPAFVEAKARRDIGVHNGWMVNDIYRAKVREVGLVPTTDIALSVDHPYLHALRVNCVNMMEMLNKHCQSIFG